MLDHKHGVGKLSGRKVLLGGFLVTLTVLLCSLAFTAMHAAQPGLSETLDQSRRALSRVEAPNHDPVRLQLRQPELGTPRDRGDNRTEEIFAWWHPHRELPKQRYTHKDLLVAIPSSHSRLDLVLASRKWRRGVKTYILMDEKLNKSRAPPGLMEGINANMEYFDYWPEPEGADVWSQPGDARSALVAWRANATIGNHQFKWILYGDDDTLFAIDNVLAMVNRFDHNQPYFLADNIWFPEWDGDKDHFVHGSRRAPRCLPGDDFDPLQETGVGWEINEFKAIRKTPCQLHALCAAPNGGIINRDHCAFIKWRPGFWFFSHGGAGAILSEGLARTNTYRGMEDRVLSQRWYTSGDSLFTESIFTHMGILPTDPGYGYFRKHVRLFDPGFRAFWEGDTVDMGNDPMTLINMMKSAMAEDGACNRECDEQLRHIMTVHVRQFTAPKDVDEKDMEARRANDTHFAGLHPQIQAAVLLVEQFSETMHEYGEFMGHPHRRKPSQTWMEYFGTFIPGV